MYRPHQIHPCPGIAIAYPPYLQPDCQPSGVPNLKGNKQTQLTMRSSPVRMPRINVCVHVYGRGLAPQPSTKHTHALIDTKDQTPARQCSIIIEPAVMANSGMRTSTISSLESTDGPPPTCTCCAPFKTHRRGILVMLCGCFHACAVR